MSEPAFSVIPTDDESTLGSRDWPHAPPHRLAGAGIYFLTARTRQQQHLLATDSMKDWFQDKLLDLCGEFHWRLEAWAILSNHYHIVAHSPVSAECGTSLGPMIQKLHSLTTKELNQREQQPGRARLWQNYRETHLTFQHSYLARLHYMHQNAAHHGLVKMGSDWKWCSAAKFKAAVSPAWLKTISSFKYDQIAREDDDE
jgi:putative transposase